jgi:hypothetical protein
MSKKQADNRNRTSWNEIKHEKIKKTKKKNSRTKKVDINKENEKEKAARKKRQWQIIIARLARQQKKDMENPSGTDNTFNRGSEDIYHRGRRSGGSGFSRR